MARYYEDIRVLGGTVSIGSLTSSTGNIFEVHGTSSVDSIIIGPSSSLVFDKDIITATLDTEFQVSGASYYMLHVDDRLYVTNYNTASLLIYDNDLNLIESLHLSINQAYYMAHNPTLGRIYIGHEDYGTNLSYYDIALNSIVTVNTGQNLGRRGILKFNPVNNKVIAFDAYSDVLYVFDANLIYEQTISIHSEVTFFNSAYPLGVNLTTGDIFIPYTNYQDTTQVAIFDSTFTEKPLVTINKHTAHWMSNIEFDPINNRMVWGVANDNTTTTNEIVFIDGLTYAVTLFPLPQSALGSTNVTGGSYVTFDQVAEKLIVFAYESFNPTPINGNTSFIYIIDVNDNDSVILGPAETTQSTRYIAASNGLVFGMRDGGNFTLSKWSTLVEAAGIINADNLTSIHQYQLPNNSGTIALLDDIKVNTAKTVWVDATYGNNTTAEKYNFIKPYLTLAAAMTAAVSGDTIYVRPGTYTATSLKNGVNIHFENGTLITSGEFTDLGVTTTCRITGHLEFSSFGQMFNFNGNGNDIYIEMNKIIHNGGGYCLGMDPGAGVSSKLIFNCKTYIKNNSNGQFNFDTECNVVLNIDDVIMQGSGDKRLIQFYNQFNGNFIFNFNKILITGDHTGETTILRIVNIADDASIVVNGNVVVSTNTLESTAEFLNGLIYLSFVAVNNSYIRFNIKKIRTEARQLVTTIGYGSETTKIIFDGVDFKRNLTTANFRGAVRHARRDDKMIFNNCKIAVGSDGVDDNIIIGVGQNSNLTGIYDGYDDYLNMEFINCQFIKESLGTDNTALFLLDGENSNIFVKNCDIILSGTMSSPIPYAFDADTLAEGGVYFRNTASNIDVSANIADIGAISGFIANDNNLDVL